MPTLAELRSRYTTDQEIGSSGVNAEEVLVSDVRGQLSPAQMVERKLRHVLPRMQVPLRMQAPGVERLILAGRGRNDE